MAATMQLFLGTNMLSIKHRPSFSCFLISCHCFLLADLNRKCSWQGSLGLSHIKGWSVGGRAEGWWANYLPSYNIMIRFAVVVYNRNPSTQVAETAEWQVQGLHGIHCKFKVKNQKRYENVVHFHSRFYLAMKKDEIMEFGGTGKSYTEWDNSHTNENVSYTWIIASNFFSLKCL